MRIIDIENRDRIMVMIVEDLVLVTESILSRWELKNAIKG